MSLARDDGAIIFAIDGKSKTRDRTELALIVITLLMTADDFVVAREPLNFRRWIGAFDGAFQLNLLSGASSNITRCIADFLHTD